MVGSLSSAVTGAFAPIVKTRGDVISIVVGALIIAIGLAYGIGRRNGYKQSH